MNREDMMAKVGLFIFKKYKTQANASKAYGFNNTYLSNALLGRKNVGGGLPKKLLEDMGMVETVEKPPWIYTYEKEEK